jgi:hypothetical protein
MPYFCRLNFTSIDGYEYFIENDASLYIAFGQLGFDDTQKVWCLNLLLDYGCLGPRKHPPKKTALLYQQHKIEMDLLSTSPIESIAQWQPLLLKNYQDLKLATDLKKKMQNKIYNQRKKRKRSNQPNHPDNNPPVHLDHFDCFNFFDEEDDVVAKEELVSPHLFDLEPHEGHLETNQEEEPQIYPRTDHLRKEVLWIAMTQPAVLRPLETIYEDFASSVTGRSETPVCIGDEARCTVAHDSGVCAHTLNIERSASLNHSTINLVGYGRGGSVLTFPSSDFLDEVAVDAVWMRPSYLRSDVLRDAFYDVTLFHVWSFLKLGSFFFLPACPYVLSGLFDSWNMLSNLYEITYLDTESTIQNVELIRITKSLDLSRLGKTDVEEQLKQFAVTYQDLQTICGDEPSMKAHFPVDSPNFQACYLGLKKKEFNISNIPGSWECPICTFVNPPHKAGIRKSFRANYHLMRCLTCQSLKPRESSKACASRLKALVASETSEQVVPVDDPEWFPDMEESPYISTKKRTNLRRNRANDVVHKRLSGRDPLPTTNAPHYTVIIWLIGAIAMTSQRVIQLFDLSVQKKMATRSESITAIEKSDVYLAMMFVLDRAPHAVLGKMGIEELAKLIGDVPVDYLTNDVDHLFCDDQPYRPVVVNTDNVAGMRPGDVADSMSWTRTPLFGSLPYNFLWMSIRQQFAAIVEAGIESGVMLEWIRLCSLDERKTICLHIGPNIKNGKPGAWTRGKNGRGVAVPGLFENNAQLSPRLCQWVLALETIVHHMMILETLSGTSREGQAHQKMVRQELLQKLNNVLNFPPSLSSVDSVYRKAHACTLAIGSVGFQVDHQNGRRFLLDNINLGMYMVDDWGPILGKDPIVLKKFTDNGIPLKRSPFSALFYTRQINDSQSQRMSRSEMVDNLLARELLRIADEDEQQWFDCRHLEIKSERYRFVKLATSTKRAKQNGKFPGKYCRGNFHLSGRLRPRTVSLFIFKT